MPSIRKMYIEGRFGQIHARFANAERPVGKPPLVCLHQSPKCSLEFETFMRAARAERDVLAVDHPGYGMSDPPTSEAEARIQVYAEAVITVMDALGLSRVDLFGNHTGSMVAVEIASQIPDRVRAISTVSAMLFSAEEVRSFAEYFKPVPLDDAATRVTQTWQRIMERRGPGVTLEMLDRSLYQSMMAGENYDWGHTAAFAYAEEYGEKFAKLSHPMFILDPDDDLSAITQRAIKLMKNGEIIDCRPWTYGFLDANPEQVAELVFSRMDACEQFAS